MYIDPITKVYFSHISNCYANNGQLWDKYHLAIVLLDVPIICTTILILLNVPGALQVTERGHYCQPSQYGTYYNSKILYNVIFIGTEWLYCLKYIFFITADSV